jgi:hypothetical protein
LVGRQFGFDSLFNPGSQIAYDAEIERMLICRYQLAVDLLTKALKDSSREALSFVEQAVLRVGHLAKVYRRLRESRQPHALNVVPVLIILLRYV